jgi:hypothetical protein
MVTSLSKRAKGGQVPLRAMFKRILKKSGITSEELKALGAMHKDIKANWESTKKAGLVDYGEFYTDKMEEYEIDPELFVKLKGFWAKYKKALAKRKAKKEATETSTSASNSEFDALIQSFHKQTSEYRDLIYKIARYTKDAGLQQQLKSAQNRLNVLSADVADVIDAIDSAN